MRRGTRPPGELVRQTRSSSSGPVRPRTARSKASLPQNEKPKPKKKPAPKIDRRASGLVTQDEVDYINRRVAQKNAEETRQAHYQMDADHGRRHHHEKALMEEMEALHYKVLNLERQNKQLRASLHYATSSGTLTPPGSYTPPGHSENGDSAHSSRAEYGDTSSLLETLELEELEEVQELKDLIARRPSWTVVDPP